MEYHIIPKYTDDIYLLSQQVMDKLENGSGY